MEYFSHQIYPFATNGTVIQVLSINNDWWSPMLDFDYNNYLITQTWNGAAFYHITFNSFILPLNKWTHIVTTFSIMNGLRLYVNGTLVNQTSLSYAHETSGSLNILSVGACPELIIWCSNAETQIIPNQYRGKIDEMKIYSEMYPLLRRPKLTGVTFFA
jgi:hypothetical protein